MWQRLARHRWDAGGALAVALFALSLTTDFLRGPAPPPALPLGDPAADIQLGEEWMGLYRSGERVGLLHLLKSARPEGGFRYESQTRLRFSALGTAQALDVDVTADLSAGLVLEAFDFSVNAGPARMGGHGEVHGLQVVLTTDLAGERSERTLELSAPPVLSASVGPILSRLDAPPGSRHTLNLFDPISQRLQPVEIEVIGPEDLPVMGQSVPTLRVRQRVAGLVLDGWMNARGEMLRQELGLGLVALRESAAEARWGLAQLRTGKPPADLLAATMVSAPGLPRSLAKVPRLGLTFEGLDPTKFELTDRRQRLVDGELQISLEPVGTGASRATTPEAKPEELQAIASRLGLSEAEARATLAPEPLVESAHPKLVQASRRAVGDAADTLDATRRILRFIKSHVRQQLVPGVPSALTTLTSGAGDCNEHSALFAALARAAGVPTRVVVGLVYIDGRFGYHAWNEVQVTDGWLSVDATWQQVPADVGHVALLRGGLGEQVRLLPIFGALSLRSSRVF